MNRNLDLAIADFAKADALIRLYASTFFGECSADESARQKEEQAELLFDVIQELMLRVSNDLDALADDLSVVDAIYAVNAIDRTLKSEQ